MHGTCFGTVWHLVTNLGSGSWNAVTDHYGIVTNLMILCDGRRVPEFHVIKWPMGRVARDGVEGPLCVTETCGSLRFVCLAHVF